MSNRTSPITSHERVTVLIVTAPMGGGHDAVAAELARRLSNAGIEAPSFDLLSGMRWGYGHLVSGFYRTQLHHAMWSYEAIYRLWRTRPGMATTANRTNTRMARGNLIAAIERHHPIAVVSTYNMASQVVGELIAGGDITAPLFTFVTDYGFHPYWLHPSTSGYFTVHDSVTDAIAGCTDVPVVTVGPLVSPRFTGNHPRRADIREARGIRAGSRAPLIVAGAWGVGDVDATWNDLSNIDDCTPMIVCGENERLARRLRRRSACPERILGWVDDMAELMAAADLLVENAGGLTVSEAFASSLPVVTYRPIGAHGTDNAIAMAAVGVTRYARNPWELERAIDDLAAFGPDRDRLIGAGRATLRADAAALLVTGLTRHDVVPAASVTTRAARR